MPETTSYRQSPLAPLGLAGQAASGLNGAGIGVAEPDFRVLLDLRVELDKQPGAQDAVEKVLGLRLPETANTATGNAERHALWLGPNEWQIVIHDSRPEAGREWTAKLREALQGIFCAVVDVSNAQAILRVTGPAAREVLERAVPLDMHAGKFQPGEVKQTVFGRHCGVTLHLLDDAPTFDIYCRRSFAEYVHAYLKDCARGACEDFAVLEG
ncbi:sarcosine oxidase subunit gamma [Ferruginivarius sediminum]|uniref:sarcosine oxidase subunit gamma n=1 Tax=Ferruginivarius sediminum TaxID=2661937 RepID=UPI001379FD11|nr:sarcosine oxidase subunit gamma family protein [Ferruginivarius sediminum]